jgi:Homeodomain-like domain
VHPSERRLGFQHTLADVCGVRLSLIEPWRRRYRTTGALGPKPHAGGRKPRVDEAVRAFIRQVVHDDADATLGELCARLADGTGVRVSPATMCRSVPQNYGQNVTMLGTLGAQGLQAVMLTLALGGHSGKYPTAQAGEKSALIVEGEVTLTLGDEVHVLSSCQEPPEVEALAA